MLPEDCFYMGFAVSLGMDVILPDSFQNLKTHMTVVVIGYAKLPFSYMFVCMVACPVCSCLTL